MLTHNLDLLRSLPKRTRLETPQTAWLAQHFRSKMPARRRARRLALRLLIFSALFSQSDAIFLGRARTQPWQEIESSGPS